MYIYSGSGQNLLTYGFLTPSSTLEFARKHSGGCQGAVKRILGKIDGVESVDANLETKLVTISYDDSKVSPQTMDEKLQKVRVFVVRFTAFMDCF